jgi:RNA polymerase sigma-70 factor (ECF subfamily)
MRLGPSNGHTALTIDLQKYLDGLYRYGLVLSRNQAEAEDLVQETCLRALRAMERLKPDSNVKSWLFTILRNDWLNQLRRSRKFPIGPLIASKEFAAGDTDLPESRGGFHFCLLPS